MAPKKAAKKAEPEAKEAAPASERVLRKRKADVPAPTEKPEDIPAAPEPAKKAAKAGGKLKEGDTIPSAPLTREDGQEVDFADLAKDQGIVIFLYPRANTGGCTKQAQGYAANYQKIKDAGFEVYGMSFDSPKSQTSWKTKYDLPYHLLTDGTGKAITALGALKSPKGVVRSHVVIRKGGEVASLRVKISPGDSVAEGLETILDIAAK